MSVYTFHYSEQDDDGEFSDVPTASMNIQGNDISSCLENFYAFWEQKEDKAQEKLIITIQLVTQ